MKPTPRLKSLFLLTTLTSQTSTQNTPNATSPAYTNPILDKIAADPWVIKHQNSYLLTYTTNDNITLLRSPTLTDWDKAETKLLFTPPPNTTYSFDLWAPELHAFNERWYVIFTADVDADSPPPELDMRCDYACPAVNHRMFVLESSGSDPWESSYEMKAELDTYGQFAIDGTYLRVGGALYHVYSCWEDAFTSWPAMLCISRMSNPWTISSPLSERTVISRPSNPWEKTPFNRKINDRLSSNEAPQQLTNPSTNQTFIIYSAARSDNRNYCLGLLELVGADPMDAAAWVKNDAGCVFAQDPESQAFGVGHASFTTNFYGGMGKGNVSQVVYSSDAEMNGDVVQREDWIVYHGMRDPRNGWAARTIRTQQFYWDAETGWPVFGMPGYGPYAVPAGQ